MTALALALWSNGPAGVDLLSFDAGAGTVADGLLDEALDPVALGLSGSWGRASKPARFISRKDQLDLPVWYSLIGSLKTREQAVDLYTPVATELRVPVSVDAK